MEVIVGVVRVRKVEMKIELFTRLIDQGYALSKACETSGISNPTAISWLRKGQAGDPRFRDFFHKWMSVQGTLVEVASMTLLDVMQNGTNEGARVNAAKFVMERAAGWLLPAKDAERDGPDVIEAEPVDGALTPAAVATMSPEQLVMAIREVARSAGGTTGADPEGLWDDEGDDA